MRLLLVAMFALMPASAGAVALQNVPRGIDSASSLLAKCKQVGAQHYAYRDGKKLKPRKLTELPPANAYIAIVRNDGVCEVPVIVRYNLGGR
ncbi:MAG: hypothetical protein ACJ8FN_11310 [Sphingomicrobium sp.]|jgi:hypothetical protein